MNWFNTPQDNLARPQASDSFGSARAKREQRLAGMRLLDGSVIEGVIHVIPTCRPIDLLNNKDEQFIAVTAARISEPGGETRNVDFVAINKGSITILYEPQGSPQPEQDL